jgi:hypothetical protein
MKKVVDLEKLAKLLNIELIDLKKVLDKINSSSCDEVCEHTQ